MSKASLAVAALFVCATARADAPEQTPENAQRFLATALPGHASISVSGTDMVGYRYSYDESWVQDDAGRRRNRRFGPWPITKVGSADVCVTNLETQLLDSGVHPDFGRYMSITPEWNYDWRIIVEVTVEGSAVIVKGASAGSSNVQKFNLESTAMADRVGYAMEFLRLACDRMAQTGF